MQIGFQRVKPEITTSIVLDKRSERKDGTFPLKLRITYQRKYKYYGIKMASLIEADYNKIYAKKPKGAFKQMRMQYDAIESRAIYIIDHVLDDFSYEAFEKEFNGIKGKNIGIKEYFEEKIKDLKESGKVQTESLYLATWISLKKFDKGVSFEKVNVKYLKRYEDWMLSEGNTYTTIGMYMRNLRHMVNLAISDGKMKKYPFGSGRGQYQIPVSNSQKKALSLAEIQKLVTFQPEDLNERKALDFWTFSYLCNGMNMIDIAKLKRRNLEGDSLKFIRQKTKDSTKVKTVIDVYLLPEAKEIIARQGNTTNDPDDFVFPILSKELSERQIIERVKQHNKNTNKYVRRIAGKVGINDKITTYYARHSYSTVLKRAGASIEFISEQLGHQSTKVTRHYLDSFEEDTRKKFAGNLLNFKKEDLFS